MCIYTHKYVYIYIYIYTEQSRVILAQYYYNMSLARLGMGEGERANTSAGSRACCRCLLSADCRLPLLAVVDLVCCCVFCSDQIVAI